MNIFVATKVGQGMRKNDFSYVPEGELVRFGTKCDGGTVDDHCGCSRSMVGVRNHKATTTVLVVDKDITREQYLDAIRKSFKSAGYARVMSAKALDDAVKEDGEHLLGIAAKLAPGFVYEIRGNRIGARGSYDKLSDPSVLERLQKLTTPSSRTRKLARKPRKRIGASSQLKGLK